MTERKRAALVTGSGKNIGRACVLALAKDGFNVVINGSSDRASCGATADAARALGADALVIMADVGDKTACDAMAAEAIGHFGGIDVLINNAAIRPSHSFLDITDETWERVLDVNMNAAFRLARACLPGMVDRGWGRIVNFAGMNAIHGYNGRAHVSVSKHGSWGLTKALGKEFGPKGITTNIISSGPIAGDHSDPAMAEHIASMKARVPVGRLGTPEEIAGMIAYLVSDQGGFMNGQLIQINGGTET
ncbi:MAG: SDR family oxidoreductase [Alphaproteobacteria bacterium]